MPSRFCLPGVEEVGTNHAGYHWDPAPIFGVVLLVAPLVVNVCADSKGGEGGGGLGGGMVRLPLTTYIFNH